MPIYYSIFSHCDEKALAILLVFCCFGCIYFQNIIKNVSRGVFVSLFVSVFPRGGFQWIMAFFNVLFGYVVFAAFSYNYYTPGDCSGV